MKRSRFTEEQIIAVLREQETGVAVTDLCRKVSDIDSERMRIRVQQGKGRRDRDALLSPELLTTLRT